jgi:PKD repeat protein
VLQAASGQATHGIQADPKWVDRDGGDFHLLTGSPAIDSADSGATAQPSVDVEGNARVDDPATPNTGVGPRTYDDRGAYEFGGTAPPADAAPNAQVQVTPSSGAAPLLVTADASASTDTDATPIASYTFDFGDGSAPVGPQPGSTAAHTYSAPRPYTVTVTVSDTGGLTSTATATVQVAADAPPTAALTVTPSSGAIDLAVRADASASTDSDGTPIATYAFDFGDGSPSIGPQAGPKATHTYTVPGTYTVTMTATDTAGLASVATAKVTVVDNPPTVSLKVSPVNGSAPLVVTATATASDGDATPVATYTFDSATVPRPWVRRRAPLRPIPTTRPAPTPSRSP